MPFISPIARDGFDGADTANIDDRTPDGDGTPALAVGLWARHAAGSSVTGTIGIAGNVAVKQGPNDAIGRYVINNIPSLPNTYRTELRAVFPETDTGGTPGTDPYVEPWRYKVTDGSGTVYEDGLVADLVTDQTFAYNGGNFQLDSFTLWPSGQPQAWEFEHDAGGRLHVHFYTRVHKTATGSHTYPLTLTWTQARDPELIDPPGPDENTYSNYGGSYFVNNLPVGGVPIPLGPQNVAPDHTYPPFYYPDGQPATVTYTPTATTTALPTLEFRLEGEPGSSDPGRISIDEWAEMALDGTTIFDVGTPPSGGNEWAYFEACVRHDPTLDTGYLLGVEFSHLGASPKIFYWLYEFDDGVYTLLRQSAGLIDYAHDLATLGSLEIDSANILHAYDAAGALLWDFALGTDLADGTGEVVALHETGLPGVSAWDDSDGAWMQLEQCTVYIEACEGDDDNPYPWDPPTPEPIPTYLYVMHQGQWRAALVPTPEVPSITVHQAGDHRTAVGAAVMYKGAWRFPVPDIETIPEPDTPEPPYHDPCYLVPPIDPGPVLPITGRFFGMANSPIGSLGPLFTGTQKALGPWYNQDLPEAVSRGATLVGAQGGGALIKLPGNVWDLDKFLEGSRTKIGPVYSLILAHTASGGFFGYSMADDVTSASLWRPSGVPINELAIAIATLRSEFPGIRLGARMRPSQAPFDPGFDFYYCQYSADRGPASSFAATEYALALSRNAYLIVCLNYLHGGNGSSGIRYFDGTVKGQSANNWFCSPAEVATYIPAMLDACMSVDGTAAKVPGVLGYQYYPPFLAVPGMLDAMVVAHNAVAALPPP